MTLTPFLPIIGHPITLGDLAYGIGHSFDHKAKDLFAEALAEFLGLRHIYFLNSGLAAFYIILEALKNKSSRKEVILPAYTAPNLILAIRKAGLKPALCDISLVDFNADLEDVLNRITPDTLCVLGVHMFGIPWQDILSLREKAGKDVFIVEDCAQAFGVKIEGGPLALAMGSQTTALWPAGSFSDAAFYSFNRGKNLPTYEGGCIAVNSNELAGCIEDGISRLPAVGSLRTVSSAFKSLALALSFNPYFYGLFFPFISCFKDNRVAFDFEARAYSLFQSGLGYSLFKKSDSALKRRFENGMRLLSGLQGIEGIILPRISGRISPAFNRLPVVFKDETKIETLMRALDKAGIESSRLYRRPLHHIFDLGYKKEDFPNAVCLAKGLLTLPAHPLVKAKDINKMIRIIRDVSSS
ncbi:MAG TPA: DegT/DnrJ/EryC1/StrS family aminotransferase [Candidatus Omnitrophota bacterium]|nr:DegT/DnrJ/EryC1/StrS family aminotransferase [Candidatus Omnitrophota bacterium]